MTHIKTSQGIIAIAAIIRGQLCDSPSKVEVPRAPVVAEMLPKELQLVLELSLTGGAQLQLQGEEALRCFRILEDRSEDATGHRSFIPAAFRAI